MGVLFCWENLVTAANITTTDAMDANLPITNLADRRLAKVARRSTVTNSLKVRVDCGAARDVHVAALLSCNFALIGNGVSGPSAGATANVQASNVALGNFEVLNSAGWGLVDRFYDQQQFHIIQYLRNTPYSARYWQFNSIWNQVAGTPAQAGRAWLSRGMYFNTLDLGVDQTIIDPSVLRRSRGQQVYADEKVRYRQLDFTLSQLTQDQAYGNISGALSFQEMFTTAGVNREVLILPYVPDDPLDSAGIQQMTRRAIYGTLTQPLKLKQQSQGFWSIAGSVIETR